MKALKRAQDDLNEGSPLMSNDFKLQKLGTIKKFNESTIPSKSNGYELYQQRYFVLFSFSVLSFVNAWIWITWSPLTPNPLCNIWNVPSSDVDELSSLYMYPYIVFSPVALLILDRYGLRIGLTIGAILNFLGSILRFSNVMEYKGVYIGTLFASLAQCFLLSIPPLIASNWFGDAERSTATSIGVIANQMGMAAGLGWTIFVDFTINYELIGYDDTLHQLPQQNDLMDQEHKLKNYVGLQMMISLFALTFVLVWVTRDKPITPPSAIAANQEKVTKQHNQHFLPNPKNKGVQSNDNDIDNDNDENNGVPTKLTRMKAFFVTIFSFDFFAVFRSSSKRILTCIYGLSVGVFYAMDTFLNQFFASMYSPKITGWLGVILIISGIFGSLWSASIIDQIISMDTTLKDIDNNMFHPAKKSAFIHFFLQSKKNKNNEQIKQEVQSQNIYWMMLMILLCGSFVSCTLLFLLFHSVDSVEAQYQLIIILFFVLVSSIGFCLTGVLSVGFEYGSALCYPSNEAAVGGALNCAAQLGGWMFNIVGGRFMDALKGEENDEVKSPAMKLGFLMNLILLFSCLLLWKGVTEEPIRLKSGHQNLNEVNAEGP